ncbi:MAG: hypothetical protein PHU85_06310 [Phycisphaerae bacterium]|nr:hypothetical protein [Phycisphaerae bacterium]
MMDIIELKVYRILSRIALPIALVLGGFLLFRVVFQVPKFEKIFQDFNTTLPKLTMVFLHPAATWVVAGLLVFTLSKELLPSPRLTLILNAIAIVVFLIIEQLFVEAMHAPLGALINSVTSGAG